MERCAGFLAEPVSGLAYPGHGDQQLQSDLARTLRLARISPHALRDLQPKHKIHQAFYPFVRLGRTEKHIKPMVFYNKDEYGMVAQNMMRVLDALAGWVVAEGQMQRAVKVFGAGDER